MAKLLNVFREENPDSHRQNGCMGGIFQMFDHRHHLLTQRHHGGHIIQHMKPHSGNVVGRCMNDNQRNSIESSRPSFSSSSGSSSFSSLECKKSTLTTQHENFPVVQRTTLREKPLRNLQNKSFDSRRDGSLSIATTSLAHPSFSRHKSIDFRGVVKDSIHRDRSGLSTKTHGANSSSQAKMNVMKYGDSPRPISVSKLIDRSFAGKYGNLRTSSEEKQHDVLFSVSKESPRFSCDSNMKSESKLKDLPRLSLDFERNPSNVVAKLMGLEVLPNKSSGSPQHDLRRSTFCTDSPIKNVRERKQDRSSSLKSSNKDDVNTRIHVEIAPWRRQEKKNGGAQVMTKFRTTEAPVSWKHDSVYYENEKKLEELEFLQSSKDFRALKQILDTIQDKRMSKTKKNKEHQQEHELEREKSYKCKNPALKSTNERTGRYVESPIVIMKPANGIRRCSSGGPSSTDIITPLASPVGLRKVRTCNDPIDSKTGLLPNHRQDKDKIPKCSPKASLTHLHADSQNKKSQGSTSPRPPIKTSSSSSSPRLQQRKHELEKKSHNNRVSSSPDLSKPRKQSKHQYSPETLSPRGKPRMKPKAVALNDQDGDNLNGKCCNSDVSIVQRHRTLEKLKVLCPSSRRGNVNDKALIIEPKKSTVVKLDANSISEQPSPISVLDASFHKDDSPSSPANEILCSFKDQETIPITRLEINTNHRKPENLEILVEKKSQLTSSEQRESAWVNHINRLYEPMNPNHIYISEILLASGLQFQDFRFHDSNHVINPNLFLVLEKRKTDSIASPESISDNFSKAKTKGERLRRKVLFDTVDEVLVRKFRLGESNHPHPKSRIPSSCCNLTQDLWLEIKRLQADDDCMQQASKSNYDNADSSLKLILSRDVMCQSEEWNVFESEVSVLALDIESLIFQNLVDEIINNEYVCCESVTKERQASSAESYSSMNRLISSSSSSPSRF